MKENDSYMFSNEFEDDSCMFSNMFYNDFENDSCMFSNEFEDEGWYGNLHRFDNCDFNDDFLRVRKWGLLT